jgi:hypothetical protein
MERGEIRRLRSDLNATRETLAQTKAEKGAADRLARVEGELRQTRRDLAAEAAKREALTREMAADRQPQANLPVVPLTPVRGGVGDGPVRTLNLPERPGWVAFWVEPGDDSFPAYRATLRTAQGTVVFQASRLALNDLGALLVTVHSTSLAPGTYRLDLDGLPSKGAPVSVGQFPLRID